jgi:hypothetical protein
VGGGGGHGGGGGGGGEEEEEEEGEEEEGEEKEEEELSGNARKTALLWTTILSSKEGHGIVRKDGALDGHCRREVRKQPFFVNPRYRRKRPHNLSLSHLTDFDPEV